MRRPRAGLILVLTSIGAVLGLGSLLPQAPRLVWNVSESLPVGLYSIAQARPSRGDVVAIAPSGNAREMLADYGVLPAGRLLLKQVAAISGETVCRTRTSLSIEGVTVATARGFTHDGRALPAWSGCRRLAADEFLALAPHASSFDGRYFGPIPTSGIVGVAHPVLILPPSRETP